MIARRFILLAAGCTALPMIASGAQGPEQFRTLANFTEPLSTDPHVSPDGRLILLGTRSDLRIYNVSTRRSTKIADGPAWDLAWSPRLDRVAWVRGDDEGKGQYVWTIAIDPASGTAVSGAQRVTKGQGDYPVISPDGKWIVFDAIDSIRPGFEGPGQPHHLSIVPVTGGPERVIAHLDGAPEGAHWSADGKSLYVAGTPSGLPPAVIAKIYVDGRPAEVIRRGAEWLAGMTADHLHLVVVPAHSPIGPNDRAVVIDTAGIEVGRVPLPVGTITEYDDATDSTLVWVGIADHRHIEIAPLEGRNPRRIDAGESADFPAWSPNGQLILFQVREHGQHVLALMRADGSSVQVLHDAAVRPDFVGAQWSPDSKSIGFVSSDAHRLMLLDVASRSIRTVAVDTAHRLGNWTWREDGKSIAAVAIARPTPPLGQIEEIRLSGDRRPLFDFTPLWGLRSGFSFVGGSAVLFRSDSGVLMFPFGGSATRRLSSLPSGVQAGAVAVSHDRKSIADMLFDPRRSAYNQLELVSLESGHSTIHELPFRFTSSSRPLFTTDDRAVLLVGAIDADTTGPHLFMVPVNGDAPRAVTAVGKTPGLGAVSLSPDGKSVAYAVQDSRVTSLLLVDLRSALRRSPTSGSRRTKTP